jgi:nucleotide-binding universal stress UspA family protein
MITVGVDGSKGAAAALDWAVDEARRRGAQLTAVYAWARPAVNGWGYVPPELLDGAELERRAQARLEAELREVVGDAPGVEVLAIVREGRPAEVLVEASHDAELLVVGSRGHGGLAATMLGSVGHACVQQALCPVVVVPEIMRYERRAQAA